MGPATPPSWRRPLRAEAGFSLVELTVVVAVIGVLAGMGLPALSNGPAVAGRRAVEVELRSGLTAALILADEAGGRFAVHGGPLTPEDRSTGRGSATRSSP